MSTTVFPITDPAVVSGGQYYDGISYNDTPKFASRNWFGNDGGFDLVATGTDLTLKLSVAYNATTATVVIDGGAPASVSMPSTLYTPTDVTLFTGLTDAAHTVSFRFTGGLQQYVAVDAVNSLSLTGAAPAMAIPSGFGPIYEVLGNLAGSAISVEGGYVAGDDIPTYLSPRGATTGLSNCAAIRFRATTPSISLWAFRAGQCYRVTQDDVLIGSLVTAPNTSTSDWVTLATGLDAGTEHEYGIIAVSGNHHLDYAVMLGSPTANLNLAPSNLHPKRDVLFLMGDSIAQASSFPDTSVGYGFLVSRSKGYTLVNRAVSSTTAVSWQNAEPISFLARCKEYPACSPIPPAVVVCALGHNDAATAGISTAEFYAAVLAGLTNLSACYPNAKILALAILNTTAYSTGTRDSFNAQISAAVAAVASPNITYVDTTGWIDAGADTLDGIHPTSGGHVKIAAQLEALIPAAGTGGSAGGGGGGRTSFGMSPGSMSVG